MTARRARRNDTAGHPHLAALWLGLSLITAAMAVGASYQGPTFWTWLLAAVAVAFAVLFVVALLPDGGPDDDEDHDPYCSQWEAVSDYDEDVLGLSGLYDADDDADDDEADAEHEQAEDASWFGSAP